MLRLRTLPRRSPALRTLSLLVVLLTGCSAPPREVLRATWVASVPRPEFDPQGPSDPVREALERALARGLTDLDSSGAVRPALAQRWSWSADRCTLRFELHAGLRFADDSLLDASHVRDALLAGLAREDHARSAHLLAAVRGVGDRRPRAAEPIGIAATDARSLEFILTRPDSMLPAKLALPGVSTPWRNASSGWDGAMGCGPYRVLRVDGAGTLVLVRREFAGSAVATLDTLEVRFQAGAARIRSLLRAATADVVWPLPPQLLLSDPPPGFAAVHWPASPERRLVLVLRQDRPPLTRPDRRLALLRAAEPRALLAMLGYSASAVTEFIPGGGAPTPMRPALESVDPADRPAEKRRSFHLRLGYDADGPAARVAGPLGDRFAAAGLYVELEPLRGERLAVRMRAADGPEALLVVVQPLFAEVAESLAPYAESPAGRPLAGFRTGWRPRDLGSVLSGQEPVEPGWASRRLEGERIVLPVARLDWLRFERTGARGARSHPRFGLEYTELRRGEVDDNGP